LSTRNRYHRRSLADWIITNRYQMNWTGTEVF